MSLGGMGDFEKGKRDPNEPKVISLLIKTYFSEYLRPERSPAARRCACYYFGSERSLETRGVKRGLPWLNSVNSRLLMDFQNGRSVGRCFRSCCLLETRWRLSLPICKLETFLKKKEKKSDRPPVLFLSEERYVVICIFIGPLALIIDRLNEEMTGHRHHHG